MLIAICAKNKQAFINGKCPRPAATSNELPIWERCNAIVLSWIMNSFSKEIFSGFVYSTDATVVWNDLKERFDKINGSRIFSLHREIESLLQGTNSVSVCYSKLRQLWDEFASLVILPTCQCEYARRYVEYDQQHHLLQFLMGLNDSYTSIRSQILKMSPLPSVGHAFTIISQEESHRSISAAAVYPVDTSASAFFSSRDRLMIGGGTLSNVNIVTYQGTLNLFATDWLAIHHTTNYTRANSTKEIQFTPRMLNLVDLPT